MTSPQLISLPPARNIDSARQFSSASMGDATAGCLARSIHKKINPKTVTVCFVVVVAVVLRLLLLLLLLVAFVVCSCHWCSVLSVFDVLCL